MSFSLIHECLAFAQSITEPDGIFLSFFFDREKKLFYVRRSLESVQKVEKEIS